MRDDADVRGRTERRMRGDGWQRGRGFRTREGGRQSQPPHSSRLINIYESRELLKRLARALRRTALGLGSGADEEGLDGGLVKVVVVVEGGWEEERPKEPCMYVCMLFPAWI